MKIIIFNRKFVVVLGVIVSVVLLLTFMTACKDEETSNNPWRLIVLQQEVLDPDIQEITEGEQHVPVLRILSAYGYETVWETEVKATLTKGDKTYIFDLDNKALYDAAQGQQGNLIEILDGSVNWKCVVIEKDIFVDIPTMKHVLRFMGENPTCEVDRKEKVIHFGYNNYWY